MTEPTPDAQTLASSAREILETLLRHTGLSYKEIRTADEDGQTVFTVESDDAARIIGRMSQTLDALQFLVNRIQSARYPDAPYCLVDTGGYRLQRKEKLVAEALRGADIVARTGRPWHMPLLNSLDRRVIHRALADRADLRTESGPPDHTGRKRVVIYPVGAPSAPAEPAPASTSSVEDLIDTLEPDPLPDAPLFSSPDFSSLPPSAPESADPPPSSL